MNRPLKSKTKQGNPVVNKKVGKDGSKINVCMILFM